MSDPLFTTLFLDVGGVLLTNGWDHSMRAEAARLFNLDLAEMNNRHALTFETYEIGKITLDVYLDRVIFYIPRSFDREAVKKFMFEQSKPHKEMLELIVEIKKQYSLRTIAVSNEGRELMEHRINHFKMRGFIDCFACSCFTGFRKPDTEVYRLALDLAHAHPEQVIYLDDRAMLAEIGREVGLQSIHHQSYEQTKKQLYDLLEKGNRHE